MRVSKATAKRIGNQLEIDWNEIDFDQFHAGMNVELEHGSRNPKTNVTNDNLLMTGKIAWIHLIESDSYYDDLIKYVENK